jgi:hypothetical protein
MAVLEYNYFVTEILPDAPLLAFLQLSTTNLQLRKAGPIRHWMARFYWSGKDAKHMTFNIQKCLIASFLILRYVQTGDTSCSDEQHNDRGNKYAFQLRFCRNIMCSCKVANPFYHPNKLQYTQLILCNFIQYSAGMSYTHCKIYVFPQISWLHPHLWILHNLISHNSWHVKISMNYTEMTQLCNKTS